jgi:hypothetical protein
MTLLGRIRTKLQGAPPTRSAQAPKHDAYAWLLDPALRRPVERELLERELRRWLC